MADLAGRREAELRAADQVVKVQAQDPVAKDQATGRHAVAQIYAAVQTGEPLTPEELQLGGTELKRLHARREVFRIRLDGILEIRLVQRHRSGPQRVYPWLDPWLQGLAPVL